MQRRSSGFAAALIVFVASGGAALAADRGGVPREVVGSWYAGSGYTSAPYSPSTGTWGAPTGKSLMYELHADGSYVKAFQSTISNGPCTTQLQATESGRVTSRAADELQLTPTSGRVIFRDSCSPSLNSDKPNDDLKAETLYWSLVRDESNRDVVNLRLASPSGAASIFRRVK